MNPPELPFKAPITLACMPQRPLAITKNVANITSHFAGPSNFDQYGLIERTPFRAYPRNCLVLFILVFEHLLLAQVEFP